MLQQIHALGYVVERHGYVGSFSRLALKAEEDPEQLFGSEGMEGLAAVLGNGLSTTCVVNIGAQVTSVICVEDEVALPHTQMTLRFGGEDVSRCLLWTQRHHQTRPPICTYALAKPIDLLMLDRLKESYCHIYVR
ncbi:putative Actin family, ATPase, nucleotide binding domain-containing protein [Helianthus annuus]|nr:putative Actin family, ATPase, nucleotide binding domain-containing protein [Helianthus annuus]